MEKNNTFSNKLKSIVKKKWFLPGLYFSVVALMFVGVVIYQMNVSNTTKNEQGESKLANLSNPEAKEVAKPTETFALPLNDSDEVAVVGHFYDANADAKVQELALIKYENTYRPNTGIVYSLKSNESFDVLASMSGKVVNVQTDSLLGNIIEIEHASGIKTHYSSVVDIAVSEGDQVMQGTAIAKAGQSNINQAAQTHLHFEIRKDDVPVNPANYFKKPLSALSDTSDAGEASVLENEGDSDSTVENDE